MKLIKWIGLENDFTKLHKIANVKEKFTSLTLKEVAKKWLVNMIDCIRVAI